jgi:DUF1680 family protein
MKIRTVSPHPYTNQRVVALARGPIIYCVEDADHPWVHDHFKVCLNPPACPLSKVGWKVPSDLSQSVIFDTNAPRMEVSCKKQPSEPSTAKGDEYIAIVVENGAKFLDLSSWNDTLTAASSDIFAHIKSERRETLRFIPYFYRANRGGKGQMRVGLRVA